MNNDRPYAPGGIAGIHHIGLVTSDAGRALDYYTRVLGLKLLERVPRRDDPSSSRLFIGSGSEHHPILIAIDEQRGAAPGREGVGGTHHFAMLVETRDALLQWKRWLTDNGVRVSGPLDRHYFESIYHRDPDGHVIELATRGAGWTRDEEPELIGSEQKDPPAEMIRGNRDSERIAAETWPEPLDTIGEEMSLRQMHHITAIGDDIEITHRFVHDELGMRRVKRTSNFDMPDSYHWYWGIGAGEPGTVVTYFERRGAAAVTHGAGQASHYALGVTGDAELLEVRERLVAAGLTASAVEDHDCYRAVVLHDPHGQRVEIATPFTVGVASRRTAVSREAGA